MIQKTHARTCTHATGYETRPMQAHEGVGDRLRRILAVVLALAITAAAVGLSGAVARTVAQLDVFQGRRLEAEADRARADADKAAALVELEEERQQTAAMLPGVVASLSDTALAGAYALADRLLNLLLLALVVYLAARRRC